MNEPSLLLTVVGAMVPLAILFAVRWVPVGWLSPVQPATRVVQHPAMPLVLGLLAAALVTAVWGSWREPGAIHDERAMLLQAKLFAGGAWRGPTPPVPVFFEQMHVFVEPGVASKYAPLHSALLALGQAASVPGVVPVALTAATVAVLFVVVRRHIGAWAAAAFTVFWVTGVPELYWRTTYLSETTTAALWAVLLYAYLRWREHPTAGDVCLMAACAALMAATRPLTAVFLTLPVAVVIAADVWRARRWSHLVSALVPVCLVAALLATWSYETLGDWRHTPYSEYSRQYMPDDTLGFGIGSQNPVRALPSDLVPVAETARALHAAHVIRRLPAIMFERAASLVQQLGTDWRSGLLVFCLLGWRTKPLFERLLGCSALSLLAGYMFFAHGPRWTVYYLEVFPLVSLLGLSQFWRVAGGGSPGTRAQAAAAVACWVILMAPLIAGDIGRVKAMRDQHLAFHRWFEREVASVGTPAIVFVRYPAAHNPDFSLVSAPVNGAGDPVWTVRDLGSRNATLCAAAPGRRAYLLDVGAVRMSMMDCTP